MHTTNAFRKGVALLAAVVSFSLAVPATAQVVATEAWARATTPGAKVAAGYLVLTNKGTEARKLLKIVTPVADELGLHQSLVDANGVSRMWPVGFLEIPPGGSVRFEPNGKHLMFTGLTAPFVVGKKVPVTLQFEGEDAFIVELEVRPLVEPAAPDHSQHGEHAHY